MKKTLSKINKIIICILLMIIGFIISAGTIGTYAATYIDSSYVTYTRNSQTTVKGALDTLYSYLRRAKNPPYKLGNIQTDTIHLASLSLEKKTYTKASTEPKITYKNSWKNTWTSLSSGNGSVQNGEDAAATDHVDEVANINLTVDDAAFKKAQLLIIYLIFYDGTDLGYDLTYTNINSRMYTGSYTSNGSSVSVYCEVEPVLYVYKKPNSYDITYVDSNTSINRTKASLSISSGVITDKSIEWKAEWTAKYSNKVLYLTYNAAKYTLEKKYSGGVRYDLRNATSIANHKKFQNSDKFSLYREPKVDVTGRYIYYYKAIKSDKTTRNTLDGVLQTKYNTFEATISYKR